MRRHDLLGNRFRLRGGSSGVRSAARVQEGFLCRESGTCFAMRRNCMLVEFAKMSLTVAVEGRAEIALIRVAVVRKLCSDCGNRDMVGVRRPQNVSDAQVQCLRLLGPI